MNPILHELQNKQWVWTAAHTKQSVQNEKLLTGFEDLDKVLSGGFPRAGMIHIDSYLGCGEVRLMLSVLQQTIAKGTRSEPSENKLFAFINPPFDLNAEFLLAHNISLAQLVVIQAKNNATDALWSAEQCVKSGACHAVFIWQAELNHTHIKKLEVAALQGNSYCVWLDSLQQKQQGKEARQNLPLSLSLSVSRINEHLSIKVNKQKVGWAQQSVSIPLPFVGQTNRAFKQAIRNRANRNKASNVVAINAKHTPLHR